MPQKMMCKTCLENEMSTGNLFIGERKKWTDFMQFFGNFCSEKSVHSYVDDFLIFKTGIWLNGLYFGFKYLELVCWKFSGREFEF